MKNFETDVKIIFYHSHNIGKIFMLLSIPSRVLQVILRALLRAMSAYALEYSTCYFNKLRIFHSLKRSPFNECILYKKHLLVLSRRFARKNLSKKNQSSKQKVFIYLLMQSMKNLQFIAIYCRGMLLNRCN